MCAYAALSASAIFFFTEAATTESYTSCHTLSLHDALPILVVSIDEGGPIAKPAPGDDAALVQNGGVYWWKQFDLLSCPNSFPIFYGQSLKGTPFVYGGGHTESVEAKPLRPGPL